MNCPSHFSLLENDSVKQMSFHSFSWGQGVISLHFLSTPWICRAYILWLRLFVNWLTTDISQLFSVMQISTAGDGKRASFSKYSHLPPPSMELVQGAGWLRGHSLPYDHLKDDILSRPSSLVSMGEWRQRPGQLSPVSICAARCLHCHTNCTLPLPVSLSLWLSHEYICSQKLYT